MRIAPASRFPISLFMTKLKITAAVLAAIILAGTGLFYKRADGSEAPAYRTATIERGNVRPTVSATGTLSAVKTIQVGTQVSGQVAAIYADYNQHVRRGQLLASIDPALQNQAVEEAQAQLERTLATMQQAEGDYARNKQLFEWKVITASEFSVAQSNFSVQKATVKSAQIALERARQNLAYTKIYAPIDGVIVERLTHAGEMITSGAPVVTIADLTKTRVEAEVDEFDAARIRNGADAAISAEGYDGKWRGVIEEVPGNVVSRRLKPQDPSKPIDTRVLLVKVALTEATPLKLGQRVEVEFR